MLITHFSNYLSKGVNRLLLIVFLVSITNAQSLSMPVVDNSKDTPGETVEWQTVQKIYKPQSCVVYMYDNIIEIRSLNIYFRLNYWVNILEVKGNKESRFYKVKRLNVDKNKLELFTVTGERLFVKGESLLILEY